MYSMGLSSPISRFPFFPCGAFLEKPRKIFFAENVRSADGRARRANPGGFLSFLFGSFSFTERKRTEKKTKKRKKNSRHILVKNGAMCGGGDVVCRTCSGRCW